MTASPRLSDLVSTGPVASRRGLSIRWHLTLFGIAVVVPVLIVAIAAAVHVASVERARTQDDALQIARNIADDIDRELDSTVAVLQALAFAPILLNGNFAAFDGLARQIANLRGADIGVRDLSGKQFINTRVAYGTPLPQNADPELRRADVMAAQTKRPVVSNLFAGNSGPSLIIDVPVLSDGEPVYILSMRFSPERIHKALTARELPISVITAVADGNYRLIARSVDSAKYLGADSTAGFRIGSKAIEGKWEGTDRTGVRISGAYAATKLANWRVGVTVPTVVLEAPLRRSLFFIAGLGAAGLSISFLLALLLGQRMSRPIRSMTAAAAALGRGDPVVPIHSGVREINQISALISGASHDLRRQSIERDRARDLLGASEARVRVLASEALLNSQERYRLLVDSIKGYAIFMLDPDGNVTTWNESAERIKGYKAEEIIGRSFSVLFPPEDIANGKPRRELEIAIADGRMENTGWRVRKNGERFWAEIVLTPIYKADGALAGFSKVTRDASLRQQQEQTLKEKNLELERAVKELDAFSYSVSHDLRAPLRAVDGFSRILLKDHGEALDEDARDLLNRVIAGAVRMGDLIDDLLNFARLGRQPLNKRLADIKAIVDKVVEDELSNAGERHIGISVGALPDISGDPGLLKQVFVNLIGNAFKYTRKRADAAIEIGSLQAGGETVLFVRDNGAGFDMQYANKLFGVFTRLHRAEDFAGTGVGLAIVKRIVERHGGRIWAKAEVDKGATFYFTAGAPVP